MTALSQLSRVVNIGVEAAIGLLTGAFTGMLIVSVFSRYIFDISIVQSVELTRIAFLWACFLAASAVAARREHIRISFAVSRLPDTFRIVVLRLTEAGIGAFGITMIWFGTLLTLKMGQTYLPTLQISQAWLYAALPVSGALIFLHALAHLSQPVDRSDILRERR